MMRSDDCPDSVGLPFTLAWRACREGPFRCINFASWPLCTATGEDNRGPRGFFFLSSMNLARQRDMQNFASGEAKFRHQFFKSQMRLPRSSKWREKIECLVAATPRFAFALIQPTFKPLGVIRVTLPCPRRRRRAGLEASKFTATWPAWGCTLAGCALL